MRLVDADKLAERVTNLEAVALEQVAKLEPSEEHEKWKVWSAILNERTAFKYDLFDAPTVDPVKPGHWESSLTGWVYCSVCNAEPPEETNIRSKYCPNCGAKMDEVEDADT